MPRSGVGPSSGEVGEIASLAADEFVKLGQGAPALDRAAAQLPPLLDRRRFAPQHNHGASEEIGHFHQVRNVASLHALDTLHHLKPVPHGASERLAHVGQIADRLLAEGGPDRDQGLRELDRLLVGPHEGALAHFHVEHQRVDPFRDLFAHDAPCDQRNALDGGGDIAQGVDHPVGRHQVACLAAHDHADLANERGVFFEGEIRSEAGNRFELVERPPRMAEPPPRYHRDGHSARGNHRGKNQGYFVPDPPGRMLVDFDPRDGGEVDDFPGAQHDVGEDRGLLESHAAKVDSHEKGGHLILLHASIQVPPDQKLKFPARQRRSIPLLSDEFYGIQIIPPPLPRIFSCNGCIAVRSSPSYYAHSRRAPRARRRTRG